jgi:hypothetical protein
MKKLLFLLAIPMAFSVTSCKKTGCTDPIASNYSDAAKKDDASCTYSEKLIIWQSYETSQLIQQAGITGLSIYVDGSLAGSFLSTNYWTGAPNCSQTGNVSATIDMGKNKTKSVSIEYKDQNGTSLGTDVITVTAGTCNTFEIQ